MPFTPFHFGPALLLGLVFRKRLDVLTFLIANIITDARAVLVLVDILSGPFHSFFHQTYLGAGIVGLALAAVVLATDHWLLVPEESNKYQPRAVKTVIGSSLVGVWIHTTLDAFHHESMEPFFPMDGNVFYGFAGFATGPSLYLGCTIAGLVAVFGAVGVFVRTRLSFTEIISS